MTKVTTLIAEKIQLIRDRFHNANIYKPGTNYKVLTAIKMKVKDENEFYTAIRESLEAVAQEARKDLINTMFEEYQPYDKQERSLFRLYLKMKSEQNSINTSSIEPIKACPTHSTPLVCLDCIGDTIAKEDDSEVYSRLRSVNRVEVIDETGRAYVKWEDTLKVEEQLQDGGKTLKIFIEKGGSTVDSRCSCYCHTTAGGSLFKHCGLCTKQEKGTHETIY